MEARLGSYMPKLPCQKHIYTYKLRLYNFVVERDSCDKLNRKRKQLRHRKIIGKPKEKINFETHSHFHDEEK